MVVVSKVFCHLIHNNDVGKNHPGVPLVGVSFLSLCTVQYVNCLTS